MNSQRAVQFRKWATRVVEEFTIKGFAMDDERLKRVNLGGRTGRLLERHSQVTTP